MKKIANVTLLVVVTTAFNVSSCDQAGIFDCDNQLRSSVPSADGKYLASVLSVQCGATTADASWVLLTDAEKKIDFESDKVAVFEGDDISVNWTGNDLQVSYKEARPFRMDPVAKGIAITYRKNP
jgi:hypothetical protein